MVGKKRRRAVAPGDGAAVSAVYESIVRPGELRKGGPAGTSPQKLSVACVFQLSKSVTGSQV